MSIRKLHKKSLNKAQQGRDFRYRPRYMPLNYGIERGGLNIADAFNVLKSGFQDFFGGQDANSDGFKDGLFRDMKEKMVKDLLFMPIINQIENVKKRSFWEKCNFTFNKT